MIKKPELCPNCANELRVDECSDDYGIIELDKKCFKCGYHYSWVYGIEIINNWLKG